MDESILTSVKKILGLNDSYTVFDQDVLMAVNSAFSVLAQIGVGPSAGYFITDNTQLWSDLDVPADQLNLAKTYICLKARLIFDPPSTSYLLDAMEKQTKEYEWRLTVMRDPQTVTVVAVEEV